MTAATGGNVGFASGSYAGVGSATVPDIDGDQLPDLLVGAHNYNSASGAVYTVFLNADATARSYQLIASDVDGFTASVSFGSCGGACWFGYACVDAVADLDDDRVNEIITGCHGCDDGGTNRGAGFILFQDSDGTIKSHQRISDTHGDFTPTLQDSTWFGHGTASLGDMDGDGIADVMFGAHSFDSTYGVAFLTFLNPSATVKSTLAIRPANNPNGFTGNTAGNWFGTSMSGLNDELNGNKIAIVNAHGDDTYNTNVGAIFLLYMTEDASQVESHQKITPSSAGFTADIPSTSWFGYGVSGMADIDGNGAPNILSCAHCADDGGGNYGACFVLNIDHQGMVQDFQRISQTHGGFTATDLHMYVSYGAGGTFTPSLFAISISHQDQGGDNSGGSIVFFVGEACDSDPESLSGYEYSDTEAPNLYRTVSCTSGTSGTPNEATISCVSGSWTEPSGGCVDNDGCLDHACNDNGDDTASCVDVAAPGSGYICECSEGYESNSDGASCVEVEVEISTSSTMLSGGSSANSDSSPIMFSDASTVTPVLALAMAALMVT